MARRRLLAVGAAGAGGGRGRSVHAAGPARGRVPARAGRHHPGRRPATAPRTCSPVPRIRRRDQAMDFAPATVDVRRAAPPRPRYFPRMLEDIAAATRPRPPALLRLQARRRSGRRSSTRSAPRRASGVEVRLAVDAIGSALDFGEQGAVRATCVAAGVDGRRQRRPRRRPATGPLGARRLALAHARTPSTSTIARWPSSTAGSPTSAGAASRTTTTTSASTTSMCRVTGPVVAQLQLVFLASSLQGRRPGRPTDLGGVLRTTSDRPRATRRCGSGRRSCGTCRGPATTRSATPSSSRSTRRATGIDIVNPYICEPGDPGRLLAAAQRGVPVRLVVPGKPTPPYPAAAFRHCYQRLDGRRRRDPAATRRWPTPRSYRIDDRRPHRRLQPRRPVACSATTSSTSCSRTRRSPAIAEPTVFDRARRDVDPGDRHRRPSASGPGTPRWTASRGCSEHEWRRRPTCRGRAIAVSFYKLQFELLWKWRPGRRRAHPARDRRLPRLGHRAVSAPSGSCPASTSPTLGVDRHQRSIVLGAHRPAGPAGHPGRSSPGSRSSRGDRHAGLADRRLPLLGRLVPEIPGDRRPHGLRRLDRVRHRPRWS